MDKKNPLSELIQECMAKAREMADTNTIGGQPISTPDGVTLIPISRVSVGFGGGGAVFGNKKDAAAEDNLGGGIGSGVKIDPVAFLVIRDGNVKLLPVGGAPATTMDRVIDMVPEVVDKVTDFIQAQQEKKEFSE